MTGQRVLVIEDEFLVALDIKSALSRAGFRVVGPAMTIAEAMNHIAQAGLNAAVVDANLNGHRIGSVASALSDRGIPFVVVSGYGRENLPPEAAGALLIEKPFDRRRLVEAVQSLCSGSPSVRE